jgi:hypothetical protein
MRIEGEPVEISPGRWVVPTSCYECFIEVKHSGIDPDYKWIEVGLLSTHAGWWSGRLRARLINAWSILRGGTYYAWDTNTAEETDMLINTLIKARKETFGE